MLETLVQTVDRASGRCEYADARRVVRRDERLTTRNGGVETVSVGESDGIGVRVRGGGAWGFASPREPAPAAAEEALARALTLAEAQPRAPESSLAPAALAQGHWEGPCR